MLELLAEYRARGGLVCVVSHAEEDIIAAHYAAHAGWQPDAIFGWNDDRYARGMLERYATVAEITGAVAASFPHSTR